MTYIRKSRLAALLVLLATLLAVAGCSGSGAGPAAAPGQSSVAVTAEVTAQPASGSAAATETVASPAAPSESASAEVPPASGAASAAQPTGSKAPGSSGAASPKPGATAAPTKGAPAAQPSTQPTATPAAQSTPSASPAVTQPPQAAEITLSIVGDSDTGTILAPVSVELEDGDSVLDVLKRATRSREIQMEYMGRGATAYVEGIDNLYEFDKGSESGWVFHVNGQSPGKSAGAYKLKAGDVVEWLYTLDMGKDVGTSAGKESGS
ncbi:DUF4430 domain-containing protein [Cohnella sp. 56]|uniref:DUF4430 domain-containing protein n=1 Tax=Cohnella sp. 56 TaxID=3113722 RepID=UPI0030E7FADC